MMGHPPKRGDGNTKKKGGWGEEEKRRRGEGVQRGIMGEQWGALGGWRGNGWGGMRGQWVRRGKWGLLG